VAAPESSSLVFRFLTHTATITMAVAVLLVLAVMVFKPKGDPPPGTAGLSTNEMLTMLTRSKMSKFEAASVANAKRKAFEAQQRAERRAREKAKRDARLRAKLKAEAEARRRAEARAEALARQANTSEAQNIAIGKQMNAAKGWSNCWSSLETMWMHESGWNERADNPGSDAYGIPQALPGSKMASAGSDWQTHAATQIAWGLSYVEARYNNPCQAWTFWQAHSWY
jgi:hypothetical protein